MDAAGYIRTTAVAALLAVSCAAGGCHLMPLHPAPIAGAPRELAEYRGQQQVRGEHLVRPDGTVGLGTYGEVHLAGFTLLEAKAAIEAHLSQFIQKPEISLDVAGYNSKVYFVVFDQGGFGMQ